MAKEKKKKDKEEISQEKIKLNSEKVREREKRIKIIKIALLFLLIILIILYFLLRIVYEAGNFTVSLDQNFAQKSGIVMYESKDEVQDKRILYAQKAEFIDNISVDWLPKNLNELGEGSHNGDNYLAYTFYIENKGSDIINYWYTIIIDDVIKNVDKAIRVMVYRNEEQTLYAKPNEYTGNAENNTTSFYSETQVLLQQRKEFKPGDIDKFTIVIFLEGDDPDCTDALIGGEIKMHMDITEEHIMPSEN